MQTRFVFSVRPQPYRGTLKFILHSKGKWDYVSITNISGTTRCRNKKSHPGNLFTAFERTIQFGEFYTRPGVTRWISYFFFFTKKRDTAESFQFPRATENNSVVINFVLELSWCLWIFCKKETLLGKIIWGEKQNTTVDIFKLFIFLLNIYKKSVEKINW